jgi:hypothetical protein
MTDTNALAAIALSIIAHFHAAVPIPTDEIPKDRADTQRLIIGSPPSPALVLIVFGKGSEHGIFTFSIPCPAVKAGAQHALDFPSKAAVLRPELSGHRAASLPLAGHLPLFNMLGSLLVPRSGAPGPFHRRFCFLELGA